MTTSARDSKEEPVYKIDYPKKVDAKDIQGNGLLLKNDEIKTIISRLESEPEKRFTKKELKDLGISNNYSIIKHDDKYYVIYKKNIYLGSGSEGRVKVAQYIGQTSETKDEKKGESKAKETWPIGKLFALKVTFQYSGLTTTLEKEHKMLEILGRAHSKIIKRTKGGFVKHQFLQELLPGENLYEYLDGRKLSLKTAIEIMNAALKQMQFIHSKGILHCDIKLQNTMYEAKSGQLNFVDLGIALIMDKDRKGHGEGFGTWGYNAPELGKVYDEKTEMYALGNYFRLVLESVKRDPKLKEEPIIETLRIKINEQMMAYNRDLRPSADDLQKFLENLPAPLQKISLDDKKLIANFLNMLNPSNKGWLLGKVEAGKFERLKGESKEVVEIVYPMPTEDKDSDYKNNLIKEMTENAKKNEVADNIIELLVNNINRDKATSIMFDDVELLVGLLDAAKKYEEKLKKSSNLGLSAT